MSGVPNSAKDFAGRDARIWQSFYLIVVVALGLLFLSTLYDGDHITASLKLIFLAVLVLTLKRWTGALLLGLVQVNLFYLESRDIVPRFEVADTLWVLVTVFLLVAVSRFRTLQEQDQQSTIFTVRLLLAGIAKNNRVIVDLVATNLMAFARSLLRVAVVIVLSAIAARVIMWLVPFHAPGSGFSTAREFAIRPSGYRAIMVGLLLFLLFLPTWLFVNEVVWRSLSKSQAGIYLRSTFLKWNHRELRMIIRKRIKVRRAKIRELQPVEPPTLPTDQSENP